MKMVKKIKQMNNNNTLEKIRWGKKKDTGVGNDVAHIVLSIKAVVLV